MENNVRIIGKKDVAGLVERLSREYQVFAPVRKDGLVQFEQVNSGSQVTLEYRNSSLSPKGVCFPQSERLFVYSMAKSGIKFETHAHETKRLVLGVRPCDAKALALMDRVFNADKHKDFYYLNRRASAIVVGLGCNKPRPTCFCSSLKGGPFSTDGLDLLLIDIGETYVVRVASDRGEKLLSSHEGFKEATEEDLRLMEHVVRSAESPMKPPVDIAGLGNRLQGMFNHGAWEQLHEKCLGCGVCTYLCPTCHCFDIVDEAVDSAGERVRIWDSCQFRLFTQETSGANPRPTGKERLRQRIMHKFSYFVESYGEAACVGCGRCIVNCPVNLDVRQVLATLSAG